VRFHNVNRGPHRADELDRNPVKSSGASTHCPIRDRWSQLPHAEPYPSEAEAIDRERCDAHVQNAAKPGSRFRDTVTRGEYSATLQGEVDSSTPSYGELMLGRAAISTVTVTSRDGDWDVCVGQPKVSTGVVVEKRGAKLLRHLDPEHGIDA